MILCVDKLSKLDTELLRFSKTCELWSSKANWRLRFSLPSNILADLSGNRTLLKRVQKILVPRATRLNLDHVTKKRRALGTRMCSKGHDLWTVIGGFWSVLCVSAFQGLLLVTVIMIDRAPVIDRSEKRNCEGGFWNFRVRVFVNSSVWDLRFELNYTQSFQFPGPLKMDESTISPPPPSGTRDEPVSQRFGHPRVLGIPIPISLAFWASPVGDAQNADRFDFA